ncbi:MAG TPA: response regulator [Phycisphaerales bacterium]|nr:response regulator [Phycisphaerales bacterium]
MEYSGKDLSLDKVHVQPLCMPEMSSKKMGPGASLTGETILVVDDDRQVLGVLRRVLERHGYRVLSASDGREALEVLDKHQLKPNLVLTDIVMPEVSGPELVAQLETMKFEVPIIYMSAYAPKEIADRYGLHESTPRYRLLVKPFQLNDVLEAVRESLDKYVG